MDEQTRRNNQQIALPLWLGIVIGVLAVLNGVPFLAPVFMKLGWESAARVVYLVYAPLCHQMAQRSFFLFGPGGFEMHNLAELPLDLGGLTVAEQMLLLRRFTGSEALGWKIAWSDRMVSMYTAPLLVALGYAIVRRRREIRPLPLWAFALLLLPMAVDGGTHWLSDLSGIGQGFRYTNEWLAALTGRAFPTGFYAGDALGSFNWLMRLISGLAFGLGVGGVLYPHLDAMERQARQLHEKRSVLKQDLLT
jgi:uncharacterized membrane protein